MRFTTPTFTCRSISLARTRARVRALRLRCARRAVHLGAIALVALALGAPLDAHDFWIEPTTFTPATGAIIGIRARVGDGFLGDPVPRDSALLEQLVMEDEQGRRPVAGQEGGDPVGLLRVSQPGLKVIGYLGKASRVELPADKFNSYLEQEGLDAVAALRVARHQTRTGARELFTRCAKTLLLIGATNDAQRDRTLGCPLELVADRNPYTLSAGDALVVRVLHDGHPLSGTLVVAMNRKQPSQRVTARADRTGQVALVLPAGGVWMIKAVHMVPAPPGSNADWASYWASLTFDMPAGLQSARGGRP